MCFRLPIVLLTSLWLLCALLPTAQSQSRAGIPEVRVLAGPTVAFSGEMAFQGQVRMKLPLNIRSSIEPFIVWRERSTTLTQICPIAGPCPVELLHHNDVFGVGVAVTVDPLRTLIPDDLSLYVGASIARHWLLHDENRAVAAVGYMMGGQLRIAHSVSLGGEVQFGFSRELRGRLNRGVSVTPVLQLVIGG